MGHHGEGQCPCHLCDAGPLQEIRLIDHILEKHWKELCLPKIGAADLVTMLSWVTHKLNKFENIFNTNWLLLCSITHKILTHPPSNSTVCLQCVLFSCYCIHGPLLLFYVHVSTWALWCMNIDWRLTAKLFLFWLYRLLASWTDCVLQMWSLTPRTRVNLCCTTLLPML